MSTYLSLFIDKEHSVVSVHGDIFQVLDTNESFIHKGMSLFEIAWDNIIINAPKLNKEVQSIQMLSGDYLTFFIVNIPSFISPDHYTIIIHRTSRELLANELPYSLAEDHDEEFERSPAMEKILTIISNISQVDSTVLLLGETGVGKTWLAKHIHEVSSRKKAPFVSINCGALPASLIESELFGYEPGTFTGGQSKGKKGLFEVADGGVVFLDEIGELPFSVQAKLLEVLQEHTFRKIGGAKNISVDIRIIAATNADLKKMVEEKTFREDLYYRLNIIPLLIPPLRERPKEIISLANQFLKNFNIKYNQNTILSSKMKEQLLSHHWPGNIRELENTIERIVVTQSEEQISDVRQTIVNTNTKSTNDFPPLIQAKKDFEKKLILDAYEQFGTTYRVADVLQVDQSTIAKKLKQYREEGDVNNENN